MSTWTCLHLDSDADGISRVDFAHSIELSLREFAPPAPPLWVATGAPARSLAFAELPPGWKGGWHPSPSRQWVICLGGEMGYRAGDGTTFTMRAGSYILTTDTRGQGHDSWNAGDEPVRLMIVQID